MLRTRLFWFSLGFATTAASISHFVWRDLLAYRCSLSSDASFVSTLQFFAYFHFPWRFSDPWFFPLSWYRWSGVLMPWKLESRISSPLETGIRFHLLRYFSYCVTDGAWNVNTELLVFMCNVFISFADAKLRRRKESDFQPW